MPAKLDSLRDGLIRGRVVRRRMKVAGFTLLTGVVLVVGWTLNEREEAIATTPIRQVTVAQVAAQMRQAHGHELVLVLYYPQTRSRGMVETLQHWAAPLGRSRVEVMAFMAGQRRNAQVYIQRAAEEGMTAPSPVWLSPWRPGTLDSTMAELGVSVGRTWSAPLVAVIDADGNVVAQWQGDVSAATVIAAAERVLLPDSKTSNGSTQAAR